jgi:hypothetical protein
MTTEVPGFEQTTFEYGGRRATSTGPVPGRP